MDKINFGKWDSSIHEDVEQLTRYYEAKNSNMKYSINHVSKTANFIDKENEEYETTLDSCTCSDFKERQLPCKHIYKLAMMLGKINSDTDNYKSSSSINNNITNSSYSTNITTVDYMYNPIISLFKYLSIAILVIGLIGGLILGKVYSNITVTGYYFKSTEETYNFVIMLSTWIGCGVLSAIFLAIYEHLNVLNELNDTLYKIYKSKK